MLLMLACWPGGGVRINVVNVGPQAGGRPLRSGLAPFPVSLVADSFSMPRLTTLMSERHVSGPIARLFSLSRVTVGQVFPHV